MKLIYCQSCGDVVRLIAKKWRRCYCRKSGGQYNEDMMTATVGGRCSVIGIGNAFFTPGWIRMAEEQREECRRLDGYSGAAHPGDVWYGEYPGDKQIFRIPYPNEPRLKVAVKLADDTNNKVIVIDRRQFTVTNQNGEQQEYFTGYSVIVPANPHPSFKWEAKDRWVMWVVICSVALYMLLVALLKYWKLLFG